MVAQSLLKIKPRVHTLQIANATNSQVAISIHTIIVIVTCSLLGYYVKQSLSAYSN